MSKPVQLLKQQMETLTAATAKDSPSAEKDKFIQSALTSLTTYRPYPSTFLPILEKLRFTGWADVKWTPTSWETFLTHFPNGSSSTKFITPDGISLTSIESQQDEVRLSEHLPATVKSIVFGTARLQTNGTAQGMFRDCMSLKSLDLYKFDTSNLTSMRTMFANCSSLTALDLSNFDTHAVVDMSIMFGGCESLSTLNITNFDTSKVTTMQAMFDYCSSLTSLDLSNFDTHAVTTIQGMFGDCSSLTSLDLSNFDTRKVEMMDEIFAHCSSLTSLDISSWDTSALTGTSHMFQDCTSLKVLKLPRINNQNIYSHDMFEGCSALRTLICTKTTLDICTKAGSQLLNPDSVGSNITDDKPHEWRINNLKVVSVR